jgi:hypothetical protein
MVTKIQAFSPTEFDERTLGAMGAAIDISCRKEAVKNALADLRIEGLFPSEDVKNIFAEFAEGRVSVLELAHILLP